MKKLMTIIVTSMLCLSTVSSFADHHQREQECHAKGGHWLIVHSRIHWVKQGGYRGGFVGPVEVYDQSKVDIKTISADSDAKFCLMPQTLSLQTSHPIHFATSATLKFSEASQGLLSSFTYDNTQAVDTVILRTCKAFINDETVPYSNTPFSKDNKSYAKYCHFPSEKIAS